MLFDAPHRDHGDATLQPSTFDEFVKERTLAAGAGEAPDWEKRRADWLDSLDRLYSAMEQYLRPYVESGAIRLERAPIELTEDYLGTYDAEVLTFVIGPDKVFARPIGSLLIGADGRVDLSGPRQVLKLVHLPGGDSERETRVVDAGTLERYGSSLVRNPREPGWYISCRPPSIDVIPLREESFRAAIMDVTGG